MELQAVKVTGQGIPDKGTRLAESDRTGAAALAWELESKQGTRLWDVLDNTWTAPLPNHLLGEAGSSIQDIYLKKVVFACSSRDYTSAFDRDVKRHIRNLTEVHKDAEMLPQIGDRGQSVQLCTGCGLTFRMEKRQDRQHVEQMAKPHESATVDLVRRYGLEPPPVSAETPVNGASAEPVELQVERSGPASTRRRRRRHRGRG